jgi:hypothetical protein
MKKPNSITLAIMGVGLLPLAHFTHNEVLKAVLAVASIVLSIMAIVRNFQEKKKNRL